MNNKLSDDNVSTEPNIDDSHREQAKKDEAESNSKSSVSFSTVLNAELTSLESLCCDKTRIASDGVNKSAYMRAHDSNLAGLAFSGGGIRSATFNLGVIQALSRFGVRDADTDAINANDDTNTSSRDVSKESASETKREFKSEARSLLSRFDYLSTVSGGGYIGSWFSAWVHRERQKDKNKFADEAFLNEIRGKFFSHPTVSKTGPHNLAETQKSLDDDKDPLSTSGFPQLEHGAIRFLRRYSNYLTPRLGMSGDLLALVSIFLRNFVLLQLVLITLLVVVLLVQYMVAAASVTIIESTFTFMGIPGPSLILLIGLMLLLFVFGRFGYQIAGVNTAPEKPLEGQKPSLDTGLSSWTNIKFVTTLVVACWLIVVSAAGTPSVAELWKFVVGGIVSYIVAWTLGHYCYRRQLRNRGKEPPKFKTHENLSAIPSTLIAGLVFGLLAYACALKLNSDWASTGENTLAIITFGPPILLAVISFIVTIHIGTAGAMFSEMHREWWARIGGFVLYAMIAWTVVCMIAYYATPFVNKLGNGWLATAVSWAVASGAGALFARNASMEGASNTPSFIKRLGLSVAPWIFLLGLAVLVSFALNKLLLAFGTTTVWPESYTFTEALVIFTGEVHAMSGGMIFGAFIASVLALLFMTTGLDINIFSAHAMYKNRLTRAYLGASRIGERGEHAFTGFSPGDDLPLQALNKQRPLHILNTTVNMTGGDDLAWQTRRAASFSFTPEYVGFETKNSRGEYIGGYRPTSYYGSGVDPDKEKKAKSQGDKVMSEDDKDGLEGPMLGAAMAISGAAATPNMGYHTSPPVAALLTAFNLRLGFWGGNPSDTPKSEKGSGLTKWWKKWLTPTWWKKRPTIAISPILAELTGSADASSDWINLSDGGHFDNLGIYELVRRRCRFIVVTDAGCDPQHNFDDLANTIRKCWTDFGVNVRFPNIDDVSLQDDTGRFVKQHGTLGFVEYPAFGQKDINRLGLILYLKSSISRKENKKYVDLRQYAASNITFPHETTADQFFDENQFEAYRHLGYRVVEANRHYIQRFFNADTGYINVDEVNKIARELSEPLDDITTR